MADPHSFQPGDVVRLGVPIGEIGAGLWVVTQVDYLLTLNRLSKNEDGDCCTILPQVKITHDEAAQLIPLHLNIFHTAPAGEEKED